MLIVLVSFLVDRLWLHLGHWKSRRQMRRYQFFLPITVANLIIERWVLLFYGGGGRLLRLFGRLFGFFVDLANCLRRSSIDRSGEGHVLGGCLAGVGGVVDGLFFFVFLCFDLSMQPWKTDWLNRIVWFSFLFFFTCQRHQRRPRRRIISQNLLFLIVFNLLFFIIYRLSPNFWPKTCLGGPDLP